MKQYKKDLSAQKIVETEIKNRGQGNDWETAYVMIHELVQRPEWRLFRTENTIFLIHNHRNEAESVEFFIYNADTPEGLKSNLTEFFKSLKKSGFNYAIFEPVGKHTADLIKRVHHKTTEHGNIVQVEL